MKTYNNYHLALSKCDYEQTCKKGIYNNESNGLSFTLIKPAYHAFKLLLQTYGGKWGWNRRPKYYNNYINIKRRLDNSETRLFIFYKDGNEIGYCLITAPEKFRSLSMHENRHVIEIENIALAPQYNAKGYGKYFLQEIFGYLFQEYQTVYLSSRSTNHAGVVPFYQKMGMSVIHIEKDLPDDLIQDFNNWTKVKQTA